MLPDTTIKTQEKVEHDIAHYRKQGASMMIVVPKSLREFLNWQEGELLYVTAHHNTLVVIAAKTALIDRLEQYVKATDHIN